MPDPLFFFLMLCNTHREYKILKDWLLLLLLLLLTTSLMAYLFGFITYILFDGAPPPSYSVSSLSLV